MRKKYERKICVQCFNHNQNSNKTHNITDEQRQCTLYFAFGYWFRVHIRQPKSIYILKWFFITNLLYLALHSTMKQFFFKFMVLWIRVYKNTFCCSLFATFSCHLLKMYGETNLKEAKKAITKPNMKWKKQNVTKVTSNVLICCFFQNR